VQQAVEMGAYIGVAGNVTYKNADHIRALVKSAPTDRVLLETDAPFLPPTPHRGALCEPWMIQLTQKFLAEELQINEEILITNTLRLFPQFI
jgi:TatD DNase family protein